MGPAPSPGALRKPCSASKVGPNRAPEGGKLLLILLRRHWDHFPVDPLRPRGFYPPRGFFFLIRLLRRPHCAEAGNRWPVGHYSRVMVTPGFLPEPSERTVILMVESAGIVPTGD